MRLVLDSSVLIAAVKPSEPGHAASVDLLSRLRCAIASSEATAFAPPELWLEVHVVEQRLAASGRGVAGVAMSGLRVELVAPADLDELTAFLALLTRRMRGRRPFANATDLAYLWAASSVDATVVTLDEGLLRYHGVVCDVTRPGHVRLG